MSSHQHYALRHAVFDAELSIAKAELDVRRLAQLLLASERDGDVLRYDVPLTDARERASMGADRIASALDALLSDARRISGAIAHAPTKGQP